MAGIYIHIPFCKQACHYCNFHFSTSLKYKNDLIKAILKEIETRQDEITEEPIKSLYLGGGTPSLLTVKEIKSIFDKLSSITSLEALEEVTLEANPDDLTLAYTEAVKAVGIDRLSIGIQSFFDEDLKWMNRAHSVDEAKRSIEYAKQAGFNSLSIDLIYGSPTTSMEMWEENLETFLQFDIDHLSAYALTVEPKTALEVRINKEKSAAPKDEAMVAQFNNLQEWCKVNDFEAYEISNYCKKGRYAKHNTNYWFGKPYIGLGPSAHSFNGTDKRSWNVANNIKYIKALQQDEPFSEHEILSIADQANEMIMTRLRTKWGLDLGEFRERFGQEHFEKISIVAEGEVLAGHLVIKNETLLLTNKGKLLADAVSASIFLN